MKKRTVLALTGTTIAGTMGALYGIGVKLFLSVAFDRKPIVNLLGSGNHQLTGKAKEGQEWLHEHDHDIRVMTNREGMKLKAHYIPAENAKRTIIEFHGWHGSWDVEFSASSPRLHDIGCNLLLVEERGQGASEGELMTFGIKEKYDVLDWVNWYQKEIDGTIPIYLGGVSMGASTVLMATAEEFPTQVKAAFSDCGFSSAYDIIKTVGKESFHLPEHPFMDSLNYICKKQYGFDMKDGDAKKAVQHSNLPILFVHGKADKFVPYHMCEEVYKACTSEKDILLVEDATHGRSFLVDTEGYMDKLQEFFDKYDSKD